MSRQSAFLYYAKNIAIQTLVYENPYVKILITQQLKPVLRAIYRLPLLTYCSEMLAICLLTLLSSEFDTKKKVLSLYAACLFWIRKIDSIKANGSQANTIFKRRSINSSLHISVKVPFKSTLGKSVCEVSFFLCIYFICKYYKGIFLSNYTFKTAGNYQSIEL